MCEGTCIYQNLDPRGGANLLCVVDCQVTLFDAACVSCLLEGLAPQLGMESSLGSQTVVQWLVLE